MIETFTNWVADIYHNYGWLAAIIVIVVLVMLVLVVVLALGIDGGDMARWLGAQ